MLRPQDCFLGEPITACLLQPAGCPFVNWLMNPDCAAPPDKMPQTSQNKCHMITGPSFGHYDAGTLPCVPVKQRRDRIVVAEFAGKWSTLSRVATIILETSGSDLLFRRRESLQW